MIARRKLPGGVLVVPYGTGIGDMVNMRPLLKAIAGAHQEGEVLLLCDPALAWLLPPGVSALPSVHGIRPWRRMRAGGLPARGLSRLSVASASRLLGPLVAPRTVRWMTGYLRRQEFPVVVNLLEMLVEVDGFSDRWTRSRRQPPAAHVVDLLAASLEKMGAPLPAERRAPRLAVAPASLGPGPSALISPASGSTLKEAPVELWEEVVKGVSSLGMRPHLVQPPGSTLDPALLRAAPDAVPVSATLPELTRLIAGADVVVGPDTGVIHIAAATGTPYVGLFGATDPRFTGPYPGSVGELIEARVDHPAVCRRCWQAQMLPSARCPVFGPSTCLSTISPAAVVAAVSRVLAAEQVADHHGSELPAQRLVAPLEPPHDHRAPKPSTLQDGGAEGDGAQGEQGEPQPARREHR